ncbi:DUF4435 domain-containing protein [Aequorivita sp. F47161]|uniref:DUF4435 domain-containing protein n=1 Tax=Aequorivita vitellina TaxID=2874475 RepID=A0A9X1QZU9_9FLAO|nr:DUF4435 domain-containing protein [Aequorivita vitellina]MCG2420442.1 DUF4435 domain-containing protein [Aequorivita vitellina]
MLKFKDFILPNVGLFFRYKNNVDVFIEDSYDDEFYLTLVNRVFEKTGHKINKLISLGCKSNVLAACSSDQSKRDVLRVYIVDGDLELITDTNEKSLKHLFVLDKYCIENYLIHKESIIEIIHDYLVIDRDKIEKQLSFENWLKGISKDLIDLFLHYSISKEVCPTLPTISLGVGKLCEQIKKIPVLNEDKCNLRIADIKKDILKSISEEEYNDRIYALREKWPYNMDTLLKIVSGKDYIMPLLEFRFHKFKTTNSINIRRGTLRLRLAKLCDITELKTISSKIE